MARVTGRGELSSGVCRRHEPISFCYSRRTQEAAYAIQAVAHWDGHFYRTGWQSVGYAGLRPYNQYKPAQLKTRKVDVKLAPGLRIGYVMGTGDLVPEAIEGLELCRICFTASELTSERPFGVERDCHGIRAYSPRPELTAAQSRLAEFVRRGGTLIVQYQSGNFPARFVVDGTHSRSV